jgi:hypothetical protein
VLAERLGTVCKEIFFGTNNVVTIAHRNHVKTRRSIMPTNGGENDANERRSAMRLKNGWTWDDLSGTVCHFRHHPKDDAHRMVKAREAIFAVDTVSFFYADGKPGDTVHRNTYFVFGLANVIGLAARIEIQAQQICEEVVGMRRATEAERKVFYHLFEDRIEQPAAAISERQARQLGEKDRESLPDRAD